MRNKVTFLLLVSGALLSLVSCSDGQGDNQQRGQQQAMPFPVSEIATRSITTYKEYPTSLEGTLNSVVRARATGYITDVLVDEGEFVKKGQILFKLETQTLDQEKRAAQANLNVLEVEVNKLKPLVEKGIVSEVQLQTARANYEKAKANYGSVVANIDYATVRSPADGRIGSINFREGSLISPQDPTPLTQIAQTENIYAFFSMNERDYLNFIQTAEGATISEKLKSFPKVSLKLVNGAIYEEEGTIETVSGQVDPSTGTVNFRAIFPNPNGLLSSGNSGKIMIPTTFENALIAPATASFEQQGKVYMYRVQGDTLAVSTTIEIMERSGNILVLSSGMKEGDKFVAEGVGKLRNGTPIIPQPVAIDSIIDGYKKVFK